MDYIEKCYLDVGDFLKLPTRFSGKIEEQEEGVSDGAL
ncbi:hypothetical protein X559_0805 [Paenilisteria newyorkensis]|nr:hypothetical protein X559_0805 [Listeria newyorkensis]